VEIDKSKLLAEILVEKRELTIQATGKSMFPALVKGDRILLRSCGFSDAKIGDIILARFGRQYCLHRVVRESPLTTKGDSLTQVDPPIEEVFGKVWQIEKTLISRIRRWKIFFAKHIERASTNRR
jgi:hypothetical protein